VPTPKPTVNRRLIGALTAAALLLAVAACDPGSKAHPRATGGVIASAPPDPAKAAADVVAKLSDEDLAGQVLMPYAYGYAADQVSDGAAQGNQNIAGVNTPTEMIAKYRLGGLILVDFASGDATAGTNPTSNVDTPQQVYDLTAGLQAAARKLPAGTGLLIGTDQEYGSVTRIRQGVVQLPSAMAMGAGHDPALTEAAWAAAGGDLAALGINVDFAPDADVLGTTGGIIGSRSFGSDPKAVADQVAAAAQGLQRQGVAATLKHFPGHGKTSIDSHASLPRLNQSLDSLTATDLVPFQAGIDAGAMMVMSGHLDARAIDPGVPASFSSKVLIDLLRTKMGFTGVVITDAMNMAPAMRWPAGEAAVRALNAGNDMLLMPPNLDGAYQGILAGLRSGSLKKQRLVEAATRILTLKFRLAAGPPPGAVSDIGGADQRTAALAVASAAITVLSGRCEGPIVTGPIRITTSAGRDQQREWLTEALRAQGAEVVEAGGTQVHLIGYLDAAGDLSATAKVTVAMDAPYLLRSAQSATKIATYSSTQAAMQALAAVILGKAPAPGRSPVAVSGLPRSAC
jgi:beta-N-acetylhexosaminidase